MEDLERKKEVLKERLQRRDDERLAEIQQRRTVKDSVTALNETQEFFNSNFQKAKKEVVSGLEDSGEVPKEQLLMHFDNLSVSLQKLQKFVSDSSVFLTARDLSKSQIILQELQSAVQEKREELIPKKKFAFKSKKKEVAAEKVVGSKSSASKIAVGLVDCNFVGRKSETLVMQETEVTNHDVALSDLTDCTVILYGSPSAIHVDKLVGCTVRCGPVSGSIFIDQCVDCVFVLACQQLRIHNTTQTSFYIHVTSKAIIEDCSNVLFAPYTWEYDDLQKHYLASGLNTAINNWSDIDDFNWLASDKKSPNWDIIAENDRINWH